MSSPVAWSVQTHWPADPRHVGVYDEGYERYVDATVGLGPHLHALTASTVADRNDR